MEKKAQMPITQVTALIIALIVFVVAVVLVILFRNYSSTFSGDIWNVLSFSWLFGHGF